LTDPLIERTDTDELISGHPGVELTSARDAITRSTTTLPAAYRDRALRPKPAATHPPATRRIGTADATTNHDVRAPESR
jgi:hypothetical protein